METDKQKLLPNLDDDALIQILEYLDKSSRLQLMSVCKRFEQLIGTTPQLYRDFELTLNAEFLSKADNCQALANIRRYFKLLKVVGVELSTKEDQFKMVQALFNKIGSKLTEIWFDNGSILVNEQFLMLMQQAHNLKQLHLDCFEFEKFGSGSDVVVKTLQSLETLHIENVTNHEILHLIVPSTLKKLTVRNSDNKSFRFWSEYFSDNLTAILTKTNSLESLSLEKLVFTQFDYNDLNSNIKNLSLLNLNFSKKSAFEKFTNFMKIQKKVSKLQLAVGGNKNHVTSAYDELKRNNYRMIFEHLLNLESLEEFRFNFNDNVNEEIIPFSTAKICNPTLSFLDLRASQLNLNFKIIARCFPNVTHLKLGYFDSRQDDITSIKFFENLEKLEIFASWEKMFGQIECKKLIEFVLLKMENVKEGFCQIFMEAKDELNKFVEKNQQLERFYMPCTYCSFDDLEILLKKLPQLTNLKLKVTVFLRAVKVIEDMVDLIGQNYGKIKHLNLELDLEKESDVFYALMKKSYPHVNCEQNSKKVIFISK